jgi:hypothetical protein
MIQIKNKHYYAGPGEYIGRGSPLGNPFKITKDCPREEAIKQYDDWLMSNLIQGDMDGIGVEFFRLLDIYIKTGSLNLLCFCKPSACHGDIIKRELEKFARANYASMD